MAAGDDGIPLFRTKDLRFMDITYPDVSIAEGEMTFIVGESGTGKTSLLRMFNQTLSQTSGSIFFRGADVSGMDTLELRKKAILCGQSVFLFDGTVPENFDKFRSYRGLPPLPAGEMEKYLGICCADLDTEKECKNMSGGERARAFIAIALSFGPEVLLLDEPTSALDFDTAAELMGNLKDLYDETGMTVIAVSHDRGIVGKFADRTIDLGGKKDG